RLVIASPSPLPHSHPPPRPLHSFPTRRSSDLERARRSPSRDDERAHERVERADERPDERPRRPNKRPHERVERPYERGRSNEWGDRKSTRLNSSHVSISYAVFCLKKKKHEQNG